MAPPSKYTLRTGIYPAIDPSKFKSALDGKVALVTGSGRGIGKHIAAALATAGASVAVSGRTKSEVDATASEILASGGRAVGIVADGLDRNDLQKLVAETTKTLGEIDILVCNAGTNMFMPFHMTDADDWWYQMEIMVKSPVELTRMVLPTMRARNSGVIIYTSSRAAKADLPWTAAYNCAKTSITRFAGSLQAELDVISKIEGGENRISLFSIHPGEVETQLHSTAFPEKTKQEAPYVIEFMDKISKNNPHFEASLSAWTCVYLAAGKESSLKGRYIDCTQDIEELRADVESQPKPMITNSCG